MSLDGVQEKLQMIWNGENIKTKDDSRKNYKHISKCLTFLAQKLQDLILLHEIRTITWKSWPTI